MLYCISNRKAMGFDSHAWVHGPWSGCGDADDDDDDDDEKGLGQQIIDHGFVYAAVLEELDDLVNNELHSTDRVRKIVSRCLVSIKALQRLIRMLEQCSPGSHPNPSQVEGEEEEDVHQDTNRILLQITAMTLELGLSSSIGAVSDRADSLLLIGPDHLVGRCQKPAAANRHHTTPKTQLEKGTSQECSQHQRTTLAKGIVERAGVVMERRLIAADRLLLPLEIASRCLRDTPCPEYQRSVELRRQLLGLA